MSLASSLVIIYNTYKWAKKRNWKTKDDAPIPTKIKAQINLSQLGIITAQNYDHYIYNASGQLKPFALSLHPVISSAKHQI